MIKVGYSDLVLGKPLPFDLIDEDGLVLLTHGYVLRSEAQIERLVMRGVYYDFIEEEGAGTERAERVSVYQRVQETAAAFAALFAGGPDAVDYRRVMAVAGDIQSLCALDPHPVLAAIHLYRTSRYALRHVFGTAVLTEVLLKHLGRSDEVRRDAVAGALTMNMAMLDLQDALYKQEQPLTGEQKRDIVTHPLSTVKMLRAAGVEQEIWLDVAEHHHEMLDGSGYAKRLAGQALSIEAQTVSLADRYCAMVSERAYRPGTLPHVAVKELLTKQAATIDPSVAAAFSAEMGAYPPGTVLSLANGEVAVVVKRTLNANTPVVRSLRASSGVRHAEPPKRLTSKSTYAIRDVLDCATAQGFDHSALWPTALLGDEGDEDE
ncbi:MAG TPA: HD domain-containing phosphohydrolase [Rhodocyclaceae bacterium]|nr:HD domain-containing phosphohydrolase [Rhodocyclaceae bacterium]